MHLARLLILPLMVFLAAGCGEQTESVVAVPGPAVPAASRQVGADGVFRLVIDDRKQGVGNRPLVVSGTIAASLSPAGAQVDLLRAGAQSTVRATLADGTVLLADLDFPAADVAAATGKPAATPVNVSNPPWLWVTPISHVACEYRRQSGVPGSESVARVKTLLGIGAKQFVNRPWADVPDSRFSSRVFFRQARAAGGVQALTEQLIGQIQAGSTHSFRVPTTAGVAFRDELVAADGGATKFLGTLLDNTVADCAASILLKSVGWIIGKCGKSSSTDQELQQIESMLNTVEGQITGLSSQLTDLGVFQLQTNLNTAAIDPVQAYTQLQQTAVSTAKANGYVPFSPRSNTGFLSAATASLQTNLALTYAEDLLGACLNLGTAGGNLFTGYNQTKGDAYGSNAGEDGYHPESFFYDFRNDAAVTPDVLNYGNLMLNYLAEAVNMLAENQHLSLNGLAGTPPAGNITACQAYLNGYTYLQSPSGGLSQNGLMAMSQLMQQQLPLGWLGGESPLPSPGPWAGIYQNETQFGLGNFNGTLWAAPGYSFNEDGKDSGTSLGTITAYNVAGYYGWAIPAPDEVKQLFANAVKAYQTDNPGGTASTNDQIAYGLGQMGLLGPNYQSGDTVMVYCNLTGNFGESPGSENAINLQVYSTANYPDGSPGGNGYYWTGSDYDFRPQGSGNDALVLLVRPLPGQPSGSTFGSSQTPENAAGLASTSTAGVPPAVLGSSLYKTNAYLWNTDLMLACNYPPSGLVVQQDGTQMHAYALWTCECTDDLIGPYQLSLGASQFGVPTGAYLAWTEVTDQAMWLSSNTNVLEVSNNQGTSQTILGGTVTGAASAPAIGETILENPVVANGQVTGGRVLVAPVTGTLQGVSLSPGLCVGGTISGGTVTGGANYTITNGTSNTTILKGCQLAGATLSPRATAFANQTQAGQLRGHSTGSSQATVTAVWLTSPSTTLNTNGASSSQQQLTASANVSLSGTPQLVALEISPDNQVFNQQAPFARTFYLTGYNSDGTCQDLSTTATWEALVPTAVNGTVNVAPAPGTVVFSTDKATPNQLNVTGNQYQGPVLIRASFGTLTAVALINVSPP